MTKQTNTITSQDFAAMLAAIAKNDSQARKYINLAFHASMRDLFNSKSVERLNQFSAAIPTHWFGKVKNAISIFTGGSVCEFGAKPARYAEPERSCVRYGKKIWTFVPQGSDQWEELCREYNAMKGYDFDCVPAKQRPSEGLDLTKLRSAASQLAGSRDKWNKRHAKEIESVLAALSGVLSGFQVSIDTEQTLLKQNADLQGKPA